MTPTTKRETANAHNPFPDYRTPLPVRRAAQQIKQAMPQMLRTRPMAPPQGMARQQATSSSPHRKEVIHVTVSIPLVVIFGILVYIAYRHMGLRAWHAIVAFIFGFLLAATTAGPQIHSLIANFVQWLAKP